LRRFVKIALIKKEKKMTDDIKQIAKRIKELRDISGDSIESLAKEFKITVDEYKKYESGETDIPVSFLYEIANKFKVELTAILTGGEPKLSTFCHVKKGKGVSVERRKQYKYQSLAYNFLHKKGEVFLVTVEPDKTESQLHFNSHIGQEFNYMLEGSMKVIIDGHEVVMEEGDALYFDSSQNHAMKTLNNKPAKFLAVIL
jgi:transcriptional regulator with XRE-family HTH domain